jgi:hypothetical protein
MEEETPPASATSAAEENLCGVCGYALLNSVSSEAAFFFVDTDELNCHNLLSSLLSGRSLACALGSGERQPALRSEAGVGRAGSWNLGAGSSVSLMGVLFPGFRRISVGCGQVTLCSRGSSDPGAIPATGPVHLRSCELKFSVAKADRFLPRPDDR